jgi:hypothetical protein
LRVRVLAATPRDLDELLVLVQPLSQCGGRPRLFLDEDLQELPEGQRPVAVRIKLLDEIGRRGAKEVLRRAGRKWVFDGGPVQKFSFSTARTEYLLQLACAGSNSSSKAYHPGDGGAGSSSFMMGVVDRPLIDVRQESAAFANQYFVTLNLACCREANVFV